MLYEEFSSVNTWDSKTTWAGIGISTYFQLFDIHINYINNLMVYIFGIHRSPVHTPVNLIKTRHLRVQTSFVYAITKNEGANIWSIFRHAFENWAFPAFPWKHLSFEIDLTFWFTLARETTIYSKLRVNFILCWPEIIWLFLFIWENKLHRWNLDCPAT